MSVRLKQTEAYTPIRRDQIEQALDSAKLYAKMTDGTYQLCRRNGATKTWKRDPKRFYIPFKHGFRGYGQITEAHLDSLDCLHPEYFRHVDDLHVSRR